MNTLVNHPQASGRALTLFALLLLVPAAAPGQQTCAHDGDCAATQTCAFGVGARFGLAAEDNVCVAPGSLAAPSYEILEFGEVTTPEGTFDVIFGLELNNQGQVVGTAVRSSGAAADEVPGAAFRYTPGLGVELLVPPDGLVSSGRAITESGDVIGELSGPEGREGYFLYRDGNFQRLDRGATRALLQRFTLVDHNDRGDLVGVYARRDESFVAYRYTEAEGWVNLAARFPRLRGESTFPLAINNSGDIPVTTVGTAGLPGGFVVLGGEQLLKLGDPDGSYIPEAINDAGRVVGFSLERFGLRAFAFDPGHGMLDLHRERFGFSLAAAVTSAGVVVGSFAKGSLETTGFVNSDTLFTFDERRPQALKVVARRAEFLPLVSEDRILGGVQVVDVNERLEVIGSVFSLNRIEDENGVRFEIDYPGRFFYFSPAVGVVPLDELTNGAGPEGSQAHPEDLNDRGEILVEFVEPTDVNAFRLVGSAVMTPLGN